MAQGIDLQLRQELLCVAGDVQPLPYAHPKEVLEELHVRLRQGVS